MVETSFNIFDITVLSVVGLSALLSFFRGFVREVLSLGAWMLASIITIYFFPTVAEYLKPHVNSTAVASGLGAVGTFIISLMLISIVNTILLQFLKKGSDIGMLDNGFGLVFGVLRGLMLLSLAYYVMMLVLKPDDYPEWVKSAVTKDIIESGAKMVAHIAPDYLQELHPVTKDGADDDGESILDDTSENLSDIFSSDKKKTDTAEEPSYDWMNVQELERLMEQSQ